MSSAPEQNFSRMALNAGIAVWLLWGGTLFLFFKVITKYSRGEEIMIVLFVAILDITVYIKSISLIVKAQSEGPSIQKRIATILIVLLIPAFLLAMKIIANH